MQSALSHYGAINQHKIQKKSLYLSLLWALLSSTAFSLYWKYVVLRKHKYLQELWYISFIWILISINNSQLPGMRLDLHFQLSKAWNGFKNFFTSPSWYDNFLSLKHLRKISDGFLVHWIGITYKVGCKAVMMGGRRKQVEDKLPITLLCDWHFYTYKHTYSYFPECNKMRVEDKVRAGEDFILQQFE